MKQLLLIFYLFVFFSISIKAKQSVADRKSKASQINITVLQNNSHWFSIVVDSHLYDLDRFRNQLDELIRQTKEEIRALQIEAQIQRFIIQMRNLIFSGFICGIQIVTEEDDDTDSNIKIIKLILVSCNTF